MAADAGTTIEGDGGPPTSSGDPYAWPIDPPQHPQEPRIEWLDRGHGLPPRGCPAGWNAIDGSGEPRVCEPWPTGGMQTCEVGYAHIPGEPGCVRLGRPCPTVGDYAAVTDHPGPLVHVLAGAAPGGDGSPERPFDQLQPAIDDAPAGALILVGTGHYAESVTIAKPLTVQGACIEGTVISGSEAVEGAALTVNDAVVVVRDLRISDHGEVGLRLRGTAEVDVGALLIDQVEKAGLWMTAGTALAASDIVVQDTRAVGGILNSGMGLVVEDGSTVTIRRMMIDQSSTLGILVLGTADLSDVAVRRTRTNAAGNFGWGAQTAHASGHLSMRRSIVEENIETGIGAIGEASLSITDVIVRDTDEGTASHSGGMAINLQARATASIAASALLRSTGTGLLLQEGSQAIIEDSIVSDTRPAQLAELQGHGISVQASGLVARRVLVARNRRFGVLASLAGTHVTLEDVVIRDTRRAPGETAFGRGINVQYGGQLEAKRLLLEGNITGILASQRSSRVAIEDAVIREASVEATPDEPGRAMQLQGGAQATAQRLLIERARGAAIIVAEAESRIDAADVQVFDTIETYDGQGRGFMGPGLVAQLGGTVVMERAILARNGVFGVVATGPGSSIDLDDVRIVATQPSRNSLARGYAGVGLFVTDAATATLRRAEIDDNSEAGVVVASGRLSMLHASVRRTSSRQADGLFGRGVVAFGGADLVLERCLIDDNHEIGLSATDEGTRVTGSETMITDTFSRRCAGEDCTAAGIGIGVYLGARLALRGFALHRSDQCGLQIAFGGEVDLDGGEVADNAIGVCLQEDDYDLNRLIRGVRYRRNGVNIQATRLPIPEPPTY